MCSAACYHANRRKKAMENQTGEFTHATPVHAKFIDLTGQKIGRLTVIRYLGRPKTAASHYIAGGQWECRCDCGNLHNVLSCVLCRGQSTSCGCYQKEVTGKAHRTHGMSGTREYVSYGEARKRCNNPKVIRYPQYGGRGIQFRFSSFEEFYAYLGPKPTPKHSLNRIDNDGHYEIGNVEWADSGKQAQNKQNSRFIQVNGVTHTQSEWSTITGIDFRLIDARIRRLGWCQACSVTLKNGERCIHKKAKASA